jgi:FlaA1/EpsC-like NDP-sugar epimerase
MAPNGAAGARRQISRWESLARRAARLRADLLFGSLDAVLYTAAFAGLMLLRFDGRVPEDYWRQFGRFLPFALALCLGGQWAWGIYEQLWRHASVHEARRLLVAGGTNLVVVVATNELLDRPVPLSVAVLGTFVGTFLVGASRFQSRLVAASRRAAGGLRVIVIGAGDAGAALVHDMLRSPKLGLVPVAFLDEDPSHHGRASMGVPVEGGIDDLEQVAADLGAHQVVFAVTSAAPELVRRAAYAAERAGLPIRIVPGVASLMRGQPTVHDLRELRIEDLIGRSQVSTDLDAVRAVLSGRRVLITGAGGSIGSEIARQVLSCGPARLVLLDHDETHLHDVASSLPGAAVVEALADIRDQAALADVFDRERPHVVFHAAAHKHVPLLERHPCEAVATNVLGTANTVQAAVDAGVERFVFISTDKAVEPVNVMGASKWVGEQVVLTTAPPATAYCAVRFGNVLGSRGSVVPTFARQIEAGGPVTVTDERMTRFFMSIEEAVQLVLQAAALAQGGEVFVLDMGEPVRIIDLAQRMIRLSGRRVGDDVSIEVVGPRPGEKLTETLWAPGEAPEGTAHPSILCLRPATVARDRLDAELMSFGHLVSERRANDVLGRLFALAGTGGAEVIDLRPRPGRTGVAAPRSG